MIPTHDPFTRDTDRLFAGKKVRRDKTARIPAIHAARGFGGRYEIRGRVPLTRPVRR